MHKRMLGGDNNQDPGMTISASSVSASWHFPLSSSHYQEVSVISVLSKQSKFQAYVMNIQIIFKRMQIFLSSPCSRKKFIVQFSVLFKG